MDKKAKILIAALATVAILVPTGIIVIPMLIGDQIDDTEVSILSVDITEFNENSLEFTAVFTIDAPVDIEVSFELKDMTAVHDSTTLGPIALTPFTFSTADSEYIAECVLTIENEVAFRRFVLDYIESETVDLDVAGAVGFTGALADLDDQSVSKTVEIDGLNGLSPAILGMDLIEATANNITMAMNVSLENTGMASLDLTDVWFDIYFDSVSVGNASVDESLPIALGNNIFEMNATLGENKASLETLMSEYIMGNTVHLDLGFTGNVSTVESGSGLDLDVTIGVEVPGIEEALISVDDLVFDVTLAMTWASLQAALTVDVDITINNPMPFAINLKDFTGDIIFDDDDGYSFMISIVSYSDTPMQDLFVSALNLASDGSLGYPEEIPAESSIIDSISLTPSISFDLGCRLYGDYLDPGSTYMDIENGILELEIGGFTIETSNLIIKNIPVPITNWGS